MTEFWTGSCDCISFATFVTLSCHRAVLSTGCVAVKYIICKWMAGCVNVIIFICITATWTGIFCISLFSTSRGDNRFSVIMIWWINRLYISLFGIAALWTSINVVTLLCASWSNGLCKLICMATCDSRNFVSMLRFTATLTSINVIAACSASRCYSVCFYKFVIRRIDWLNIFLFSWFTFLACIKVIALLVASRGNGFSKLPIVTSGNCRNNISFFSHITSWALI